MQIPDYENYEIYEDGTVVNTNSGKELTQSKNTSGYLCVSLKNLKGYRRH